MRESPAVYAAVGLVFAQSSLAGDCIPVAFDGDHTTAAVRDPYACLGEVFYEQLPNANGLSSQDDVCYPFFTESADDIVGSGGTISAIGFWGTEQCGAFVPPDEFHVRLFADAGGFPGALILEQSTAEYEETYDDDAAQFGYCLDLPIPIDTEVGTRYWISVQAELCVSPQWFWQMTDVISHNPGTFRSAFFGFDDWVSAEEVVGVERDLAIVLYRFPSTPTREVTWAAIKQRYGVTRMRRTSRPLHGATSRRRGRNKMLAILQPAVVSTSWR